MPRIDVQKLVRLSEAAQAKQTDEKAKRMKKAAKEDAAEAKRIAKEILDELPWRLEEAAIKGERLLGVASMRVVGKANENGWLVDFKECDAGSEPEKYLYGYLQVVYNACKKIKNLRTSFQHRHDYGDTDQCVLTLVVSW